MRILNVGGRKRKKIGKEYARKENNHCLGVLYFLLFINNFSRYTTMYFLSKRLELFSYFHDYKKLVEIHFLDYKILILRSNYGGKFTSKAFNQYCLHYGIQHQLANPYNLVQNEISERKNLILVEDMKHLVICFMWLYYQILLG